MKTPTLNIQALHPKAQALRAGALAAVLSVVAAPALHAQSNDSLQRQIEALDQKIRIIERQAENAQAEAKAAAAKTPKVNAAPGNLGFTSADGAFGIRFSGFNQISGRVFTSEPAAPENQAHTLGLRRVQTDVRGTAFRNFGWRVHTNWAGNSVNLLDVQLDWNLWPEFNLSVGKMKPPTGLERLLSSPRAPFIEGSFVTALQPNRDIGVQASGNIGKGFLQYQAGLFNGANDNQDYAAEVDGKKDFHARVFAHPFNNGSDALKGFGLGISGSYGERQNSGTLTAIPTPGRQNFQPFTNDTLDGTLYRISPQAYYYVGPFGLIAEYTQTTQAVRNGANTADLTNAAWGVTGSWVLTGEKNSYRSGPRVAKANNWPNGSDFGAIELLARVHGITIDDAVAGTFGPTNQNHGIESALSAGGAIGWYLNNSFKIFVSYEHTAFTNVSAAPADRKAENVLSFSFNAAY
jgi:phosphate-selective porin OprO/OprP